MKQKKNLPVDAATHEAYEKLRSNHNGSLTELAAYNADVIQTTDYYSGGSAMPGRTFNADAYRYGQNTQEKDIEIGEGIYTAEFWEYDSRILRRWNTDPIVKTWESPYLCFGGNPILFSDPDGDDVGYETKGDKARVFFKRIFNKDFRKDFNAKKNGADMYTYRLRQNMPKLQDATEVFSSGRTYSSDGVSDSGTDPTIATANYNVDYSVGGGAGDVIFGVIPLYRKIYEVEDGGVHNRDYVHTDESSRVVYDDKHPIVFGADYYPDDIKVTGVNSSGTELNGGYSNTIVNPNNAGGSNYDGVDPVARVVITPNPIKLNNSSSRNDNWSPPSGTTKLKIVVSSQLQRTNKAGYTNSATTTRYNYLYYKWRYSLRPHDDPASKRKF